MDWRSLAGGYLQALLATRRQGRSTESDLIDIRNYRTKCMTIAIRSLDVLEENPAPPPSRNTLGPKEFLGSKWTETSNWLGNQVSRATPSRREEQLMEETQNFAKTMTRGLVALQAIFCFEAVLKQEPTSPSAWQACSMVERYESTKERFRAQLQDKKNVSLDDFRYFDADKKRERFRQSLTALLDPVDSHWETLKEIERQWRLCIDGVPEVLYVSVNEAEKPSEVFLPSNDAVSGP
jgi:hypothetical protein